jgi:hypothetical protein
MIRNLEGERRRQDLLANFCSKCPLKYEHIMTENHGRQVGCGGHIVGRINTTEHDVVLACTDFENYEKGDTIWGQRKN